MESPRVLVVDDDEAVRAVTREMLRRGNYEVECVGSGPAALGALEEHRFDLVMLDVGMPGMSGADVYEVIRQHWPDQKVLFMTGYAEEEIKGLDHEHTWVLSKPFKLQALNDTVAAIV